MIAYILVVFGFLMRLMPHTANMVPVGAIALFAGSYLNKKAAPWLPLAIMALSDMIIGFHDVMFYTWGSVCIIGFIGTWIREGRRTPGSIFAAAVFSSFIFFAITNFGVWIAWYPRTAEGLLACYINALPFLRNTMAGNVLFALALFGAYELAARTLENSRYRKALIVR